MATPTGTPLDAERARLRAKGHTDAEISQILIMQEVARAAPQTAGAAPVQGTMTGVLGNASAVLSHARGTIPAIQRDLANVRSRDASAQSRAKSAAALAGVAVIVAALGYAIYQEWQIHIVNAPITAAQQARKAAADADTAEATRQDPQTNEWSAEDYDAILRCQGRKQEAGDSRAATDIDRECWQEMKAYQAKNTGKPKPTREVIGP